MKKIITVLFLIFSVGVFAAGHTVSIVGTSPTSCSGTCDGTAMASVGGGVGPFGYSWNDPLSQTTTSALNLCAGSYTITVTDSSDMSTATAVATITSPPLLMIAPISPSTICSGTCVSLISMVMGGTPAYTYNWSPAGTGIISNPAVCPAGTTTYTLNVTDSYGCTAAPVTTTVTVNPPIFSGISSTNTSSCVSCNGTASVSPFFGVAPYVYLWNTVPVQTTATISGLCAGTYSVTITDVSGCTANDSATISSPPITSNYTMVPDSISGFNYWAFNTSTGDSLSYIWYFGDGDSSFVQSPVHTYASIGVYNVCLIVSNPGGCFDVKCTTLNVSGVASSCLSLFNISHDSASSNPNTYIVYNLSYGSTLSYLWDFGDGTTSTLQNPTHLYGGIGAYQICLTVDNGSGCVQTFCDSLAWVDSLGHASNPLSVTVVGTQFPTGINEHLIQSEIRVYPNPFNDVTTFVIESKENEIYSFELTDVLGKKVRSMTGISEKEFQLSRNGLQNGIYFYKIYNAESVIGIGKLIIR